MKTKISKNETRSQTAESTVYVVDDDRAVRDALRALLESADFRVESYGSAREFLDTCCSLRSGCLLLDVRMPGMTGLELQEYLIAHRIHIPIVILTGHGDVSMAVKAIKAGAVDFVEKPFDDEDLIQRIEAAISREVAVTWSDTKIAAITARLAKLSERESQVLNLIVAGKWVKAIAAELGTSPNTVRNQRTSILRKMEAGSVADLVRMVTSARLVGGNQG